MLYKASAQRCISNIWELICVIINKYTACAQTEKSLPAEKATYHNKQEAINVDINK